ncbi:MAG: wax ester/triacylglycerol synthase domain-containing protein [Myxococcota bacterium]
MPPHESTPLGPEDLAMLYADQPRQRTTMSLLMLLDRRPEPRRLRAAVWRAVEAMPRMRQCVVTSPFDLSLPRWQDDPTFDLDYHVRRYAEAPLAEGEDELDALFHAIGPIYERPFDESRPLWELIEIDRPDDRSAIFFRLHHAMADGVGGNAILAALTDAEREGGPLPLPPDKPPAGWPESEEGLAQRVLTAAGQRVREEISRAGIVTGALVEGVRHPSSIGRLGRFVQELVEEARFESQSPLRSFGRARHLSGIALDFEPLRRAKRELDGQMIDVLLCGVAGAMGRWHAAHGHHDVTELRTLVPINLRQASEFGLAAALGNRTTGVNVRLPIAVADPIERFRLIHERMLARKASPSVDLLPKLAQLVSGTPRWLYQSFALQMSSVIDLIVTNVPGIPVPRYVAGAEITAGYPIAPNGPNTPVSIALYGYRGRLFIGIDADGTAMPDARAFEGMLRDSFAELGEAAGAGSPLS